MTAKKKRPGGSVGAINKNQRKQLEALGYLDKPKSKKKPKGKKVKR